VLFLLGRSSMTIPGDVNAAREPAVPAADAALVRRALALLALLAVADFWAYHHFGVGIRNIGVPVGVAAAVGVATKAAGFIFGDDKVRAMSGRLVEPTRAFLQRVVTPGVLGFSAVLLVTAMLTVSSVTVVADAAGEGTHVAVTPVDEGTRAAARELKSGAGLTRVVVTTSPFGRIVRVDASGYVGRTFTVYPPVGLRLLLGTDLPTLSTVLFRPDPSLLGFIADGAVLRVYRAGPNPMSLVAVDTGHSGSFLLGRPRAIGSELLEDWKRELAGANADAASVAQTITLWKRPAKLSLKGELSSGDLLRAEIWMGDKLIGSAEVTLTGEPLIDVPVRSIRSDSL
jgi:hypothetical protein